MLSMPLERGGEQGHRDMASVWNRLVARDFADLRGARVSGTVPVRERLLNEAVQERLAAQRSRVQRLQLRIREGGRVQIEMDISLGIFTQTLRPELQVGVVAVSPAPVLSLVFTTSGYSGIVSLIQQFAPGLLPPGVAIRGNRILIDLGAVPQAAPMRPFWQHLKSLALDTLPGVLVVRFEVQIDAYRALSGG